MWRMPYGVRKCNTLSLLSYDIPVAPSVSFEVRTYETSGFLESTPSLCEYECKADISFRCRFICLFRDMYEVLETLILHSGLLAVGDQCKKYVLRLRAKAKWSSFYSIINYMLRYLMDARF